MKFGNTRQWPTSYIRVFAGNDAPAKRYPKRLLALQKQIYGEMGPPFAQGKNQSRYANQMELLSRRIFGELLRPVDQQSASIVAQFSQLPTENDPKYTPDYYPPHPMFHWLSKLLRFHGIFRDEHQDFQEEFNRRRAARGKVIPKPGEGKRARLRAGTL